MNALNAVMTKTGDVVLAPLAWSPLLALIAVSVVAGVAMTWVFGKTSNQKALGAAADRVRAQLLGMKLFRDDLRVAFGYQRDLYKAIGMRLAHSIPPMVVLIVPFFFILAQLALRYEYRPLAVGERAVVEVRIAPGAWPRASQAELEPPNGVVVETPALRDEEARTVHWRIRLDGPTTAPLRWRVGNQAIEKHFAGTEADDTRRLRAVNRVRPGRSLLQRLLYPGEPALDADSPVDGIIVRYPRRATPVFGLDVPWWVTFLVVSMVTALIVRPFFRVRF